MDTAATLEAFDTMPLEARLDLLFQMWDRLVDNGWTPTLDDALKEELDRRWANYQANPSSGLTWDEVLASVRRSR